MILEICEAYIEFCVVLQHLANKHTFKVLCDVI